METPSVVMVGAPLFFSSTTLRPRGPRVTLTASARVFKPRSRPRRASSSHAFSLAIAVWSSGNGRHRRADYSGGSRTLSSARLGARDGRLDPGGGQPHRHDLWHSTASSANTVFCTLG